MELFQQILLHISKPCYCASQESFLTFPVSEFHSSSNYRLGRSNRFVDTKDLGSKAEIQLQAGTNAFNDSNNYILNGCRWLLADLRGLKVKSIWSGGATRWKQQSPKTPVNHRTWNPSNYAPTETPPAPLKFGFGIGKRQQKLLQTHLFHPCNNILLQGKPSHTNSASF